MTAPKELKVGDRVLRTGPTRWYGEQGEIAVVIEGSMTFPSVRRESGSETLWARCYCRKLPDKGGK